MKRPRLSPPADMPKYTGRLGVCLATSGPGGIHLLNGLYDAKCDGQPVLAITGHTFHDLIGTHYQQDVDLDKLFMDVAVYNQRVMGPAHVVNVVDEAIKTALAQRGVAHITIPKDIQEWTSRTSERSRRNIAAAQRRHLRPPAPDAAAGAVAAGGRPDQRRLEGRDPGRSRLPRRARGSARSWPKRSAGPIVKPLLGKAVVPDDSPYTTGGIGLLGTAPSQDALAGVRHASSSPAAASRTWSSARSRARRRRCRSTSTRRASACAIRSTSAWSATARRCWRRCCR